MTTTSVEEYFNHGEGRSTWYRRTRPPHPRAGALPVVVLHGGPGMAHNYLRRLEDLAKGGREVILYDQIGCGRSSHHPDAPAAAWTVDVFVGELDALIRHWDLADGFHLLGQSWGGMFGPEYILAHPEAPIASLTLLNSPASMPAWAAGTRRLLEKLPAHVQETIARHEADGTFQDPRYQEAVGLFYAQYLCRIDPMPIDVQESFTQLDADPSVYSAMIGPSEFTITGTLADWTIEDRLEAITLPTLVGYGEHDEATDSWLPFAENIVGARVHRFDGASHTPHLERPEEFDSVVESFLSEHDAN